MKPTEKQIGYLSYNLLKPHTDDLKDAYIKKDGEVKADMRLAEAEKWCKNNLDRYEASNVIDLVESGQDGKAMELIVRYGLPVK